MKTIAFFDNNGGVGTTSLVYHLAWMFAEQGVQVVAADLDPQANLTAAFLDEDRLEELWPDGPHDRTVYGFIEPLVKGTGDITPTELEEITPEISLIPGDLALASFEDDLSDSWSRCVDGQPRAFRVESAFWRILSDGARTADAQLVLIDVGPNLGAINRSALVAADHVVIPLSPDLFSLQGLRNLGPTLRRWRSEWQKRVDQNRDESFSLPGGDMRPGGYVVLQHGVRLDRPVAAYDRWMRRIPGEYATSVLGARLDEDVSTVEDPNCLAMLKHFHSLVPMAQEARKPLFLLRPADGAIGAHQTAVQRAYEAFFGARGASRADLTLQSRQTAVASIRCRRRQRGARR